MAVPIPTLLQPAVVNARVDRLRVVNTALQSFWGMNKGGSAVRESPFGRRGSYDVFSSTRKIAQAVAPGSPGSLQSPNPVGNVNYTIPRFHPSLYFLAEQIHNQRPIGGPVGQIDTSGQQYVADQEQFLKQQITSAREFQVAAMQRGSYTYAASNPFLGPTAAYSGGSVTIDFQMPSGNKLKLNMLAAGDILAASWATASTAIITHCLSINAAFIQLVGRGLTNIQLTSVGWGHVGANTQVIAQAGTANTYFDYITRDEATTNFTARLRALPWLTFHINDNGLDSNAGAFEKFIPDTNAVFSVSPETLVAQYWECGEPISEYDGAPMAHRIGEYYWIAPRSNPTGYQLFALHNGLPILQIPAGLAFGLIVY